MQLVEVVEPKTCKIRGEDFYIVKYDEKNISVKRNLTEYKTYKFSLNYISDKEYCALWVLGNHSDEYLELRNFIGDERVQECIG